MPARGYKLSEEAKSKVSLAQRGRKHTPQEGFKRGHDVFSEKGRFEKGTKPWNKGKRGVYKKDVLDRWSFKRKGMFKGELSPLWRGGFERGQYADDWEDELKNSIRLRDCYICQECGIHQDELSLGKINILKRLDVHHIDYDKKNCNPDNLISLCRRCHAKTNFNRNYWIKYLQKTDE